MLRSRQLGCYNEDRTTLTFNTKTCQMLYQIGYIEYVLLHNALFQSYELLETLASSASQIPGHTIPSCLFPPCLYVFVFLTKQSSVDFLYLPHWQLPLKQRCLAAVRTYLKTKESGRKNNCSQPRLSQKENNRKKTGLEAHIYSAH